MYTMNIMKNVFKFKYVYIPSFGIPLRKKLLCVFVYSKLSVWEYVVSKTGGK